MLRSLAFVSVAALAHSANAISYFIDASSYISDWIPVNYTTEGNWPSSTLAAQQEIVKAADYWNQQGPWSVMNKSIIAPTGDPHDYLSWSPYWWPDCSNVHNTTELTQDQIMTQCNYYQRDGQFNPDRTLVNDTGSFAVLSSSVFYNVLAYRITGDDTYAGKASHLIDTWFVNNDTFMNPNLEYSQVIRGANGTKTGAHTGVLDLHCITKIVSGILVMRAMGAQAWTATLDSAMVEWTKKYLVWLTTNPIAMEEKAAKNNHGSFYYSQTASLQILVGDYTAATATLNEFYQGIYQAQITKTGEQPFEAERTRGYHYRSYNAGAVITLNRIADYLKAMNGWETKTSAGADIQDAVDFAMTVQPDDEGPTEAYPNIAAIASQYGDADGKYASFLASKEKTYPGQAWFFWNQPLSDSGLQVHIDDTGNILAGPGSSTNSASSSSATGSSNGNKNNGASSSVSSSGWMLMGAVAAGIATLL